MVSGSSCFRRRFVRASAEWQFVNRKVCCTKTSKPADLRSANLATAPARLTRAQTTPRRFSRREELVREPRQRWSVNPFSTASSSFSGRATASARPGDCNEYLCEKLVKRVDWRRWRGVVFLDPFGTKGAHLYHLLWAGRNTTGLRIANYVLASGARLRVR